MKSVSWTSQPTRSTFLYWMILGWVLGLLLSSGGNCLAQGNGLKPGQAGVVVLTNGQVLSGAISETGGGYRVDYNGTFATVTFEQVKVTARSLQEAYQLIHDGMKNPLAGDHLILCEWCIQQGLWEEAQTEVALALKLEPLRTDARALLWKIDQHLRSIPSNSSAPARDAAMAPVVPASSKEVSPAGISRELQAQFIRQVQPLILNKCGNGACHGGNTEREFRLMGNRSSSTNQRLTNDANLQAVLDQINLDAPLTSPLVMKPGELGASHRKVFLGPAGNNQRQLLVEWVSRVAAEKQAAGMAQAPRPIPAELASKELVPVPSPMLTTAAEKAVSAPEPVTEAVVPAPMGEEPRRLDNATLREILQQQAPDPFDPSVFNRLVHGKP